MWVFSEFSVPIVPLTKCSYHFWGLQTQIVLDAQTFFAWKPPVRQCKGNNKKSWCFWTFCLCQFPQFPNGRNSRFDGILFCLRKQPGSSAPNRVYSLSVLKMVFFRGNLFFHVEGRSGEQSFSLKIHWKVSNFEAMLRENGVSSGEVFCLKARLW